MSDGSPAPAPKRKPYSYPEIREGWIVTDSRADCTPKGYVKVWLPSEQYTGEFDKEIAGVGMNLGGLKPSTYLAIIGNCDFFRIIQPLESGGRVMFDNSNSESFVNQDAPDLDYAPRLTTNKDGSLTLNNGVTWNSIGQDAIMPYQCEGNNFCQVQPIYVAGGTKPPNYDRYEMGSYMEYPAGMHVVVNMTNKTVIGSVKKKYKPDPLVTHVITPSPSSGLGAGISATTTSGLGL